MVRFQRGCGSKGKTATQGKSSIICIGISLHILLNTKTCKPRVQLKIFFQIYSAFLFVSWNLWDNGDSTLSCGYVMKVISWKISIYLICWLFSYVQQICFPPELVISFVVKETEDWLPKTSCVSKWRDGVIRHGMVLFHF